MKEDHARVAGLEEVLPDTEVVPDHPVHADLLIRDGLVGEDDAGRLLALLALEQDGVATEQLQLVHLLLRQSHNGVVIVDGLLDDEAVGALLALQDGSGQVIGTGRKRIMFKNHTD